MGLFGLNEFTTKGEIKTVELPTITFYGYKEKARRMAGFFFISVETRSLSAYTFGYSDH
jgi:hypothetical protein